MLLFEKYILWFFLYSVLGWIYETTLCSVRERRFINRGFLNGPYCPIYGCGAVLDIILLGKIENPVALFFSAALLTSVLEYITSWAMEKLFHARWWDYSERKFNINGRICLIGVLAFGSFSVILLKLLHPLVVKYTDLIPDKLIAVSVIVIIAIMLADIVFTTTEFAKFNDVLHEFSEIIDDSVDSLKCIYERTSTYYKGTIYRINSQIRRMLFSFPRLRSTRYNDAVKKLRILMKKERDEKGKDGEKH